MSQFRAERGPLLQGHGAEPPQAGARPCPQCPFSRLSSQRLANLQKDDCLHCHGLNSDGTYTMDHAPRCQDAEATAEILGPVQASQSRTLPSPRLLGKVMTAGTPQSPNTMYTFLSHVT